MSAGAGRTGQELTIPISWEPGDSRLPAAAKAFIDMSARCARYSVGEMINAYISRTHRDVRGPGCPAAALSGEAARLPDGTREMFGAGIAGLVTALQGGLSATYPDARAKAISLLAQAVGAIMLSRACPDRSTLADEILETWRGECVTALADQD